MAVDEQEKPRKWKDWFYECSWEELKEFINWGWISKEDVLEAYFYTPEYMNWAFGPYLNDRGAEF